MDAPRASAGIERLSASAEFATISWIGSKRFDVSMRGGLSAGCRRLSRELRHELLEIRVAAGQGHGRIHVLAQELPHLTPMLDWPIDARMGAAAVSGDGDQVAVLLVGRVDLFEAGREIQLIARR